MPRPALAIADHPPHARRTSAPRGRTWTLLVVLLSTGCSAGKAPVPRDEGIASSGGGMAFAGAPPPPPTRMMAVGTRGARNVAEQSAVGEAPPPPAGGAPQNAPSQPVDPISYLAYAFGLRLELPGDRLVGVMDRHVAACRDAGLRVCQLVSSRRDGDPTDTMRGTVSLRAEPHWLQQFMQTVQGDARNASGRVTAQWTTTEDLTREIVDTEATLKAKRALRDRLQQLLATRPGKLSDLLEVESELSRVQGEIDSTASNLAATRTRVMMSALTIEYGTTAHAVASTAFDPLRDALGAFVVALVESSAALITAVGALLPWGLALTLVGWVWLRMRRRLASREGRRPAAQFATRARVPVVEPRIASTAASSRSAPSSAPVCRHAMNPSGRISTAPCAVTP